MYTVYELASPAAMSTHIDYIKGDAVDAQDSIDQFLASTRKSTATRGDISFATDHLVNGEHQILAKLLARAETEEEALILRNTYRAVSKTVTTGPTPWPMEVYANALLTNEKEARSALDLWRQRNMPTARDAYAAGMMTMAEVKELAAVHVRAVVIADLDKLTPDQFNDKYGRTKLVNAGLE